MFGAAKVLQAMVPQTADHRSLGKGGLGKDRRRLGKKDLAARGCGRDSSGPVDIDPQVVIAPSTPSPVCMPIRTRRGRPCGQACEARRCWATTGQHGISRFREHREERIPLRPNLRSARFGYRSAKDLRVLLLHGPVAGTEFLEETCGPFDVGEQEGDGTCGELTHDAGYFTFCAPGMRRP